MAMDTKTSGALGGAAQGAAIGTQIMPGWGTAIGAIAGGLLGGLSGGGEDDAERMGRYNAKLIGMTAAENRRRAELEMKQSLGYTRAAIGASNVQFSGSSRRYYNAMKSQFRQNMAWDEAKARMEQRMARKGGQVAAGQIQRSGISSMAQGFGSLATSGIFSKSSAPASLGSSWAGNDPFGPGGSYAS